MRAADRAVLRLAAKHRDACGSGPAYVTTGVTAWVPCRLRSRSGKDDVHAAHAGSATVGLAGDEGPPTALSGSADAQEQPDVLVVALLVG